MIFSNGNGLTIDRIVEPPLWNIIKLNAAVSVEGDVSPGTDLRSPKADSDIGINDHVFVVQVIHINHQPYNSYLRGFTSELKRLIVLT